MKILFDQGTPVPLRRSLPKHEVATAFERGWAALQNGELLSAAEAEGFEVLVTTDQNLRYQQNLPLHNFLVEDHPISRSHTQQVRRTFLLSRSRLR